LPQGATLVRLPAAIPDAVACPLSCATATVAAALRLAGDLTGAVLAVVGAGTLGLIASAMARSQGVACVLACDVALERGVQAARFGVEATATPADFSTLLANRTEGRGADVILELSGSAEGVELALEQVRTGGRVILVGSVLPVRPVTLLPEQVVRRCLTIQGIHNYTPDDLVAALRWLTTAQQLWPLERLVGPTFPLEQTKQAFAWASTHSGFRVAIAP
jgi:threonine dehydrogenase-like Zn-dependent dehydrogenase